MSGLVGFYSEESLVNKKVVVVCNLKPVKLRGIISEGMLLAAGNKEVVSLITIDIDIENGSDIS